MKKQKKNINSKRFKELALSEKLGETEEGYAIGTYESSRGTRYIDIRFSAKITRTLYFRLFNAATIKEATKCARLSMDWPEDYNIFPKQIYHYDTRLENWQLDQQEITDLLVNLAAHQPHIKCPDFFKEEWKRDILWYVMQQCHNRIIKNKKGFNEIPIDPEYFDIPNYNYLLPANRPKKPFCCWIDVGGIAVTSMGEADCVRSNLSNKLKDICAHESHIGRFEDEYGIKEVQVQVCETEPYFFVWNYDSYGYKNKCARISMVKARYIEPDDNKRFPDCWRLSNDELKNLVSFLRNNQEVKTYRDSKFKNNWAYMIYAYNYQAKFAEKAVQLPEDTAMPDYLHMEEPLIIK